MMHCERSIRLRCWRREPDSQYGRLWNVRHSLRLDIRGLDDGPPLLDFGLLINGEGLRRLLVAWVNLLPEVGEPRAHRLVSEGRHGGTIELGDDILWRTRWRPKGLPVGKIEPRQAGLIHRRDIRCRRHAALGRDGIGLDGAGTQLRQETGGGIDHHVDLPSDQILYVRAA